MKTNTDIILICPMFMLHKYVWTVQCTVYGVQCTVYTCTVYITVRMALDVLESDVRSLMRDCY